MLGTVHTRVHLKRQSGAIRDLAADRDGARASGRSPLALAPQNVVLDRSLTPSSPWLDEPRRHSRNGDQVQRPGARIDAAQLGRHSS